jgi:hypothetical protein
MSYHQHHVHLTEHQIKSIANAHKNKTAVRIRIPHAHHKGGHVMHLTDRQITKLHKSERDGKGSDLILSTAQLKRQDAGILMPMSINLTAPALGHSFQKAVKIPMPSRRIGMSMPPTVMETAMEAGRLSKRVRTAIAMKGPSRVESAKFRRAREDVAEMTGNQLDQPNTEPFIGNTMGRRGQPIEGGNMKKKVVR